MEVARLLFELALFLGIVMYSRAARGYRKRLHEALGAIEVYDAACKNEQEERAYVPPDVVHQRMLVKANGMLRSFYAIAERNGEKVNWEGVRSSLLPMLESQRVEINKFGGYKAYNGEMDEAETVPDADGSHYKL